jgi:transaldolase/glucose-6-phosphate isomerase
MLAGSLDRQLLRLGRYEKAVATRLETWARDQIGQRIWKKDFTVWSPVQLPEIVDRLGWLTLPESMWNRTESMRALAEEIKAKGMTHVVLLGMGGSSLAPEVFQATFGNASGYPELIVLDSTHPTQIRAVESRIDLQKTLFLVASKSGTTQEPMSLFGYFHNLLVKTSPAPGSQFIATTDPGTPLEELAKDLEFRQVFKATPDVGGRYSALTAFGLVPAALIGTDVLDLLDRARVVEGACATSVSTPANLCLRLAAALGELALAGRDKVTFITSPSLKAFPDWLEQLIAESTGKDGKGIVPIAGEIPGDSGTYGEDRFFVYIAVEDEIDAQTTRWLDGLATRGHPVAQITISDKSDLSGEMFRWELAVAAAGAVLGIHPFNQPDVQIAKDLARQAMEKGKDAQGDKEVAVSVDSDGLAVALEELVASAVHGDYFAIQAYLARNTETEDALQRIRHMIRDGKGLATTLGFGPRFLHSTGQLHKGGPGTGMFLQLVDTPETDIGIPKTRNTFGDLIRAQALGDYLALRERGRRVLRVDLGSDVTRGLSLLETGVRSTVDGGM